MNIISIIRKQLQPVLVFTGIFFAASAILAIEKIRVATFNVKNYLVTNRVIEGEYYTDYPKPEADKRALRAAIKKVDPDVLALQEMGDVSFLKELQSDLKAEGVNYPHAFVMNAEDPQRHTATLSKLPFDKVVENTNITFRYFGKQEKAKRGLSEIHFSTKGKQWILFNLHLKSRLRLRKEDPQSSFFRQSEARAIAEYIQRAYPENRNPLYLIAGDLNDTTQSKTVRLLCGPRKNPRARLVDCFDPDNETWTYFYRKEDSYYRFDYFIASTSLLPKVSEGRGFIVKGKQGSDHRMVYIDLLFE